MNISAIEPHLVSRVKHAAARYALCVDAHSVYGRSVAAFVGAHAMNEDIQALAAQYQAALQLEDWVAAERALRVLAKLDTRNPSVLYNLGLVLRRQKQFEGAIQALRNALAIAPGHHNARFELAMALFESGALPDAEGEFMRYVKAVPDDTGGLYHLGVILLKVGKPEEARRMLGRALVENESASVSLALAEAELACGLKEPAERRLRSLVADNPALQEMAAAVLDGLG